jgi:hypothetical protein
VCGLVVRGRAVTVDGHGFELRAMLENVDDVGPHPVTFDIQCREGGEGVKGDVEKDINGVCGFFKSRK